MLSALEEKEEVNFTKRELSKTEKRLIQKIYSLNRNNSTIALDYAYDDYELVFSKLNEIFLLELKARFRNNPEMTTKVQEEYDKLKGSGRYSDKSVEAVLAFNSALVEVLEIDIDEVSNLESGEV